MLSKMFGSLFRIVLVVVGLALLLVFMINKGFLGNNSKVVVKTKKHEVAEKKDKPLIKVDTAKHYNYAQHSLGTIYAMNRKDEKIRRCTGLFLDKNGWMVVPYEKIKDADYLQLERGGYEDLKIRYIYDIDKNSNLALLKIEGVDIERFLMKTKDVEFKKQDIFCVYKDRMRYGNNIERVDIRDITTVNDIKVGVLPIMLEANQEGSPVVSQYGNIVGVAMNFTGHRNTVCMPIKYVSQLKKKKLAVLINEKQYIFEKEILESMSSDYDKAYHMVKTGIYGQAKDILEKLLEGDRMNPDIYYHLGICYRELDDLRAVETLKKSFRLNSDYIAAYAELGKTYMQKNMYSEAERMFVQALSMERSNSEYRALLGECYVKGSKYTKAYRTLEKLETYERDLKADINLAYAYFKSDIYREATYALQEALKKNRMHLPAVELLGRTYLKAMSYRKAINFLNEYVHRYPKNPWIHYVLAASHLEKKNMEQAISHNKKATDNKYKHKDKELLSKYIYDLEAKIRKEKYKKRRY